MDTPSAFRLIRRYTRVGVVFGFVFPLAAWAIEFGHDGLPWALGSIWRLHATNPSVWIIDTAPLVLGILARQIGIAKHAEDTLREREELLHRIVETTADGIYVVDRDGKMTFANAALERILGATREEIARRAFNDQAWKITTVDGKPFPDELQPYAQVMRTKKPVYNVEQVVTCPNGTEVIVSINAAPLTDASGEIVGEVGTLSDITERKAVERLKNEFVSTVSHELRTPLTSIVGSLGLIMGGAAGAVSLQARAMLDIAHKNSERLVLLINDILDIEKIESGKMVFHFKPLDLLTVVEQAVEANRGYAEKLGVSFKLVERVNDATVNADDNRLIQALNNLLSNAAKFTPRNATVDVTVTRRDNTFRVSVRDKGPGVSEEFRKRIFQRFAQADSSDTRQKGGTGLGLSISKVIVEKHGGHIGFESEIGKGATFYFELPEWREAAVVALAEPAEPPVRVSRSRILVCEDDRDIATLLTMMLEQAGFQVDIALNAAQAKELLAQSDYAAMTLDIALPDQDGLALFRELRAKEETRNLPVIFVSAQAQEGRTELNGDAVMVVDWIDKPIDQVRLMAAVRQALGHHPNRTPRILHVEDDPDVCQVVAGVLANLAEVQTAKSLEEARARLQEETYDLVLLDLTLSDGSGAELIPHLRRASPSVPVVIFSAHEVAEEMANQVAAALVKSRATNEQLLKTIQALVNRQGE